MSIGRNVLYKSYCGVAHIGNAFYNFYFFKIDVAVFFIAVFTVFTFVVVFFAFFFVVFFRFFISNNKNVVFSVCVYNGFIGYGRC